MKNKTYAILLSFFLGGIGAHWFYLGHFWKGIISLLFCWTFIPVFIGIICFFKFLMMSNDVFDVLYNNRSDLSCKACYVSLNKYNVSYWGLGYGKVVCKMCFTKIKNHGQKTGKSEIPSIEVEKIVKGNIKERPLPPSQNKYNVPKDEEIENHELNSNVNLLNLNLLVQISYTDINGQKSERRITMKTIDQTLDNDYIIKAFCHEKQAQRTFKLSRISRLVDIETGEIFSDPIVFFNDRIHDSPIGVISKIFQLLEPEILILTFTARADGVLRKKEREIISNYIQSKSDKVLDNKLLDDEIRRTYCDSLKFRNSLKLISNYLFKDKLEIFLLSKDIANSDKKIDPIEAGILELIKNELKLNDFPHES